jgi:colicin import membrane protein
MAASRSARRDEVGGGSLASPGEREERLFRWVIFSSLLHIALIASLFLMPYLPLRNTPSYPIYTVDLVGGEKLGGTTLGTEIAPPPRPKEKPKEVKVKPAAPVAEVKKEVKKEQKKPAEKSPPVEDKAVVKEPVKKETVKKELPKEEEKDEVKTKEGLSDSVREKLIQAALERVRNRAENAQKKEKPEPMTTGPAEGEGAAALGSGGRGGGIVKGLDFLIYRNRMLHVIRERWAWVGKRHDLEVTVHFGVQENGEITGLKIVRASGDVSYDDSVLRAVKKSSPLPPPPENYRKDFMDVEITFRPEDLGG